MKKLFLTSLFLFFVTCLFAQAQLTFDKEYLGLDTLIHQDKYVVCKAFYSNTGNMPLYVTSVHSNCPCVEVSYNEDALAPGDTTYLTIKYTFHHEGNFSQPISVYFFQDGVEEFPRSSMRIYGYVTKKEEL